MKKIFFFLILLSFSEMYAQNVKISDYDVPISSAKEFWINGNYNWEQYKRDSIIRINENRLKLGMDFNYFYSSLPFSWYIRAFGNGTKDRDDYKHNIWLSAGIRKYIWNRKDLFIGVSGSASHKDYYKDAQSDMEIYAGYGRHIVATDLARAVRIEEHLLEDKVISAHFPKETILKIAQIIDRQYEYKTKYGDTYEVYWYRDIESEMNRSGVVVGSGIGAVGMLRTRQVLSGLHEIINNRFYGWDVRTGVDFNFSKAYATERDDPSIFLASSYSFPISWRSQVNLEAGIYVPMNDDIGSEITGNLEAEYFYELTNRINFLTSYSLRLYDHRMKQYYKNHEVKTSFIFYLENNLYLGINGRMYAQESSSYGITLSTDISIQYRLF